MKTINKTRLAGVVLLGAALGIAGCSSSEEDTAATGDAAECAIAVSDAWVKSADEGMTGAFGEITNSGATDIVLTGGTSASAGMVELHEVVGTGDDAVMQAKEGGFPLAAGESITLEPGADHIMLMGLKAPIVAGDQVKVELTCDNGATATYEAQAKDFTGGEEEYVEESGSMSSDEMSSDEMSSDEMSSSSPEDSN